MARIINGIFGGISGKIAHVEGYVRNGIAYIRIRKRKTTKPPTSKQLAVRAGMAIVTRFVKSMTPLTSTGFKLVAEGKRYYPNNAAISYQYKNALIGMFPDLSLDYSKVRISIGFLAEPGDVALELDENGVKFSWDPVADGQSYTHNSQTMLLVHAAEINKSVYMIGGASRLTGFEILQLPSFFRNCTLHCYISFLANDRKSVSNSIYAGQLTYL